MRILMKFWLIAVLAVGGAELISSYFGLPSGRLMYPVLAVVGYWLVENVVTFFQAQRREIEKIRQDITELKQIIEEELERTIPKG